MGKHLELIKSLPSQQDLPCSSSNNTASHNGGQQRSASYLSTSSRYVICEWIYQICERLYPDRYFSRRAFHATLSAFDNVVLRCPFSQQISNFYQKLAVASLLFSIQTLHVKCHNFQMINKPTFAFVLSLCGFENSEKEFLFLLQKFEQFGNICHSIMDCWDSLFLSSLQSQIPETIQNLALVLLDSYILDYATFRSPPSIQIQAALCVAELLITKQKQSDQYNPDHEQNFDKVFDEMFYISYTLFSKNPSKNPSK